MPKPNNARQVAFAQAVAVGQTVDAAYQEAGYKPHRGNTLRAKQNIAERIDELQEAAAERAEITGAEVVREIARLGLSDIRQAFDDYGRLLPVKVLP